MGTKINIRGSAVGSISVSGDADVTIDGVSVSVAYVIEAVYRKPGHASRHDFSWTDAHILCATPVKDDAKTSCKQVAKLESVRAVRLVQVDHHGNRTVLKTWC
jgi:hypothetical protein